MKEIILLPRTHPPTTLRTPHHTPDSAHIRSIDTCASRIQNLNPILVDIAMEAGMTMQMLFMSFVGLDGVTGVGET
jgi:hypothetical protein